MRVLLQSGVLSSPSVLVGVASLVVISISAVLQYISHRHNVVDTRFEREQKIKTNLGTSQIEVEEFTENEYDISIRVSDVDVRERSGRLYRLKKLLLPTADIEGTTVAKMEVKPDNPIDLGLYELEGLKKENGGLRGVFLSLPNANDMVTIEVDTVDPYDVPPTLTNNMSFSQNLELVDKTDEPEDIGELLQEISTPTEKPYSEQQAGEMS